MQKKLSKSNDKKIFGVCGGFGEYFNIDPTIIRLVFLLLFFCFGTGLLFYIICAIVMSAPES
ncbi:MAG: PspC domain-containing protein [Bacteroidetes bacterium]|nr:PspC domain-containing protein [Bacteroidota bacterium]